MKFRNDFVTNSSSSSFIVVSKIDDCAELREFMKEEYGKYGNRLLDTYLTNGESLLKDLDDWYDYDVYDDEPAEYYDVIQNDGTYIMARRISWTNDGDMEGDDAWLVDHIPSQYKTTVYEEEPD